MYSEPGSTGDSVEASQQQHDPFKDGDLAILTT